MARFKLVIKYDGKLFYGWQIQKNRRTVQGVLENALLKIFKEKIRIIIYGAGRTDSGVHAYGQVAHFDYSTHLNSEILKNALNSWLEYDCRIISVKKVKNDFHSRFDALQRKYLYQIYTGDSLLFNNQSLPLKNVNIFFLNKLAMEIIGEHDFLSFSKFNPNLKHSICKVYISEWISFQDMIIFNITSNRFLHHMIRYLVGTMIAVMQDKFSKKRFLYLLKNPIKEARIFKAPPEGLILAEVKYE